MSDAVQKIMAEALERRHQGTVLRMTMIEEGEKLQMTFVADGREHTSLWFYKDQVELLMKHLGVHLRQMR